MRRYEDNAKWLMLLSPFRQMSISAAYIVPFFLDQGLSLTEITVLQSIFSLAIVLWEAPSGWVADKIGRAVAIQLSIPIAAVGMMAYGLSSHYWQFVVWELLLAVAAGLYSGSDKAILVDSLKAAGRQDEYNKLKQRIRSAGFAGLPLGLLVSIGLLRYFDVGAVIFADGLLTAIGGVFAWRLVEPPIHEAEELDGTTALQATKQLLTHKESRWLIILQIALGTSTYIGFWLTTPYLESIHVPLAAFGAILAGRSLFRALLGYLFHSEAHLKLLMGGYALLAGLPYVLIATGQVWAALALLGHDVVYALCEAPLERRYNEQMPDRFRAMLNSVVGLQSRLVFAIVGPLAGLAVDNLGFAPGCIILGLAFSGCAGIAYMRVVRLGSFDKGR